MIFKYGNRNDKEVVLTEESVITYNGVCSQIKDKNISNCIDGGYRFVNFAELRDSDFEWMLQHGMLFKIAEKGSLFLYKLSREALTMDKYIYKPYVKHIESSKENRLMAEWSNWRTKKKELLDKLKEARSDIVHCNLLEARDILKSIVEDMSIIDCCDDQH